MMLVSEQEMQVNFSRYLDMAANGDITITRDGEAIATLTCARISGASAEHDRYPSDAEVSTAAHRIIGEHRELFEALAK